MNGREYALEMLRRNDYAVEALLDVTGGQESVWLELKADPFCLQDKDKLSTSGHLWIWHTLKAIVSFANTCGGCIVFGVDDKLQADGTHNHVPLKMADGKPFDFDGYVRSIKDEICNKINLSLTEENEKHKNNTQSAVDENGKIKNGERSKYLLEYSLRDHCELRRAKYLGHEVAVMLVSPAEKHFKVVIRRPNQKDREVLFVREPDSCGECIPKEGWELMNWRRPSLDFNNEAGVKRFNNMLLPTRNFVGRKYVLGKMSKCFKGKKGQVVLLYGPAGIGKSETVYEYCRQNSLDYDTLIRIDARSCHSFVEALASLAGNPDFRRKFLPGTSRLEFARQGKALSSDEAFMRIRTALMEGRLGQVLLLLDDVVDCNVIRSDVILRNLGVEVLSVIDIVATSRSCELKYSDKDLVVAMEVRSLRTVNCVRLLQSKRSFAKPEIDYGIAEKIADRLGKNPWALDLFGEYLKQKKIQGSSDYQDGLDQLENLGLRMFASGNWQRERVGNVTGVLDVDALYAPTIAGMTAEERQICRLMAMCPGGMAYSIPLRAAFERIYGRIVLDGEWNWHVESLVTKCILSHADDDAGYEKMKYKDALLGSWLGGGLASDAYADAYFEYIKIRMEMGTCSAEESYSFFKALKNSNCSLGRRLEVVFDSKRVGWPCGLLGMDSVASLSKKDKLPENGKAVTGRLTWEDIETVCSWAEGVKQYEPDVLEIIGSADASADDNIKFEQYTLAALHLRMKLFADDPVTLGRSYCHVAEEGIGGVLSLEEQESYMRKGIEQYEKDPTCIVEKAMAYDYLAYIFDGVDNGKVADFLTTAYTIAPSVYTDLPYFDEEEMSDACKEGHYPRFV